ncbi:17.6 kDa class I heat shock protein-like [Rhododendron vialii]|uniref:17.6 kDa class I heat shock protein-like n=1 Tax=Rhododendron vialii TaxID=182163 RepID=UPI00265E9B65|nr:17.6 kDa class I heat shock protein-like [Rhododendron vialii]
MGIPKLTPMFLLTTAITLITLTPTPTTALMPYTRNPIWDLMMPPPDIDPLRILEHAPLPIPKDAEPLALARCDWKETPSEHVIAVDVPGLRKEDVKVEVEEESRVVRISGERKAELEEEEGEKWHRAERVSARFVRQFRLPADADLEGVKVRLENGVLTVMVPKVAEEKRRKGAKVISIEEAAGSGGDGAVKATNNKGEL